jgi:IS30 family transposase|tara:strand:+ start:53 stop:1072 length:1020 start_codon:yes stop_codon:yes gene_type:complete
MGQHYHHFSALERNVLHHQLNLGSSQAQIALALGRSRSTVWREVRRNSAAASPSSRSGLAYDAGSACQASFARRRRGLVRLAQGSSLRAAVFKQIRLGWSPQQISGRLKLMDQPQTVSHETIYQAIYVLPKGELRRDLIGLLRQGRKLRRPRSQGKDRRGALRDMVSVHERPASVLTRQLPGDWEGDLIKGAGNASAIGTLAERKTRYVILTKMKDATADTALSSFSRGLSKVPRTMRVSMTYDQGKEMARHAELADRLNIKVYFCDPHSPWQRPTNENTNGLIRQYLPKGIDLSIYSQKDLDKIAESLNNRPRKVLGFRTPLEAYQTEISNQSVALQT